MPLDRTSDSAAHAHRLTDGKRIPREPLSFELPLELVTALVEAIAEGVVARVEAKLDAQGSPWMTTEEAIQYTRLAEGTFRKLAASGAIPSHGGRSKIFHRAEVDEALGHIRAPRAALRRIGTG